MGKEIFIDLTRPFNTDTPRWPYFDEPLTDNAHTMAKGGVLTSKVTCTMHIGTRYDASRHVMEYESDGGWVGYAHKMPVDAYIGGAACLPIDIEPWGLITGKHLDDARRKVGMKPEEPKGIVVCLNTGMHRPFDDSKAYCRYSIGIGVEAGKWLVRYGVKCVAMDSQALDYPLCTAIGNDGMTCMNLPGTSGKSLSEEYRELFGKGACAEFDRNEYISIHGQKTHGEKFGELEALGCWGTWKPCHKELLGRGIAGVRNLGGSLDKVNGKRFRFYCSPLRWYMEGGSIAHCAAEIDEEDLTDAPDRTHKYGGTGHQDSEGNGGSDLTYIQRFFDRNR